jgi:hypothetical protein
MFLHGAREVNYFESFSSCLHDRGAVAGEFSPSTTFNSSNRREPSRQTSSFVLPEHWGEDSVSPCNQYYARREISRGVVALHSLRRAAVVGQR